jgi:hypothetical protein
MAVVTRRTVGRLDYTTVADLQLLQSYLDPLLVYTDQVRDAMGERLGAAEGTVPLDRVVEVLGLPLLEARAAIWSGGISRPEERTNLNIRAVLEYVPFRNPLIEAWELKQLLRMYEAACNVVEDAICDLIIELRDTRPDEVLIAASGAGCRRGLEGRVAVARDERGGPGDARRTPVQVF